MRDCNYYSHYVCIMLSLMTNLCSSNRGPIIILVVLGSGQPPVINSIIISQFAY